VAVLGWTVALTATLALAAASWHLIERPLMEAVRRRLTARGAGRDRLAGSGRH
jgi:peptidoglycan/LPS O-acetylase OafA/YrhL